jgi:uncharacterized membrane protein YjgN (DUF898 family)
VSNIPPPPPPNDPYGQVPPPPPSYQPYGTPSYGAYDPSQAAYTALEGRSTTVLVLGILGIVLCTILGPIAWVMGNKVRDEAVAMGRPEPGNNKAGRICGIIGTCLIGLVIVGFVLFAVLAAVAGTSGTN